MSKDANSVDLAENDEVLIRCKVLSLEDTESGRNLVVEVNTPMNPGGTKLRISMNSRQVEKVVPS